MTLRDSTARHQQPDFSRILALTTIGVPHSEREHTTALVRTRFISCHKNTPEPSPAQTEGPARSTLGILVVSVTKIHQKTE